MKDLEKYLEDELAMLDRSIVATPSEDYLEQFVKANHGSSDYLLMQMSKNYGYKIALLNMQEMLVTNKKNQYYGKFKANYKSLGNDVRTI
jgi:hypothetical protein|tara:strand:- start:723 stop:992 length:270 start_codon:yes stop_codon:yes gene_type:complete